MFLSRLKLNPRSRQAQAELNDAYQMHRTLSKAFGDGDGEYKEARCLFRVDESHNGDKIILLVQSRTRPSWESISPSDGYLMEPPMVKEFSPILRIGEVLRFRLRANPTMRHNGKRLGLYDETAQLAWLDRKGGENGFRVLTVEANPDRHVESRTSSGSATFASVTFDGKLIVTDPTALTSGMESGIGSGKGFGFGLLSIARE